MRTKTKAVPRKSARKKAWFKRLPFSMAEVKSWLGYTLTASAFALLLLFTVSLGPQLIADFVQGLVRIFGAGVFVPLAGSLLLGLYLIAGQRFRLRLSVAWHHIAGAGVLVCLAFGLLALMRPAGISVGGIKLAEVTAGGDMGRFVLGSAGLVGLIRLVVLAAAGLTLLFPLKALRMLVTVRWMAAGFARGIMASIRVRLERRKQNSIVALSGHEEAELDQALEEEAEDEDIVYEIPASALEAKTAVVEAPALPAPETPASEIPLQALPSIDLLERGSLTDLSKVDIKQRIKLIEDKLSEYGVDAKVVEVNQGPAFTQFGIEPGWDVKVREIKERDQEGRIRYDKEGKSVARLEEISRTRVKVSRITALANDLALALAAPTIRIEAPVPGKSMVGIEVPNISASVVSLRSVIESAPFQRIKARSKLALALGQGVEGEAVAGDLARMPHLLIAGATGSGKSVCINSIITSVLMHATPEEVKLLMVDPKRVELIAYDGAPHLLCPVVVEMNRVVGVLRWVAKEMDERYKHFAEAGARNIQAYNDKMVKLEKRGLPYIVVVIDELADLMMLAADEVERTICRLAQLARATGIHLVIATQRPSVDVVTGLIKANIPTRISFAVTSQVDSRTILDQGGAEKLLGRGDMLYMPTDAAKPIRIQGTFVSDAEIESVVNWWKFVRTTQYVDELLNIQEWTGEGGYEAEDSKMDEARRMAEQGTHLSVSFLQRRLRVGYNRAKRIMEQLQDEGLAAEDGEDESFTRFST